MIVVDAPYLTYRAYCAGGADASIKASLSTMLRLLRHDPDVWLVWESASGRGLDLRRAIYPDYKCRRSPKPEDYRQAIATLQGSVTALGISQAWPQEGEGDDAAWTLVQRALDATDTDVTLWARDKDWMQMLLDSRVSMLLPSAHGSEERTIVAKDVPDVLGVTVGSVASYFALAGDTADDIPGMPGIGHRRAAALLQACPRLVALVLAGSGDQAVLEVSAADAGLAKHAQIVADNAPLLQTMLDLVLLQDVDLATAPGRYDPNAADAELLTLDCAWAGEALRRVAPDDWT